MRICFMVLACVERITGDYYYYENEDTTVPKRRQPCGHRLDLAKCRFIREKRERELEQKNEENVEVYYYYYYYYIK